MAFPVIEGTAESSTNTAGTSHAITLPASIAASDLVLIIMDIGSTPATLNALTDWTELLDENAANGLKIIYYTGTGVPSNPTFTSSASTRSASIAFRISGVNKAVAPQIGTTSSGASATPNPPQSADPPSTKDYLFITFFGAALEELDDDTWCDSPPTNYTPTPPLQKACGTAGVNLGGMIAAASRQLNTGSAEDPGTFTKDVASDWRAQTITVHPIVDTTVTPTTLALVISTFAPTVTATQNVRVTPPTIALTLNTFAPQLKHGIIPGTAALTTTAFAPQLRLGVIPPTKALTLTTFAPTVNVGVRVIPGVAALTTTGFAPQLQLGIIPPAVALTLTTFAPTVTATGGVVTIAPGLEYASRENRLHYVTADNLLHHTTALSRLHYTTREED